jgi:hypothetical protein
LTGCGPKRLPVNPPNSSSNGEVQVALPLTDTECRTFAQKFEKAVGTADAEKLDGLMDWDALLGIATSGINVPDSWKMGFCQGLKGTGKGKDSLSRRLILANEDGFTYKLLHLHTKNDQHFALFRVLMPSGQFNYHDLLLGRDLLGSVRANDLFSYVGAEFLSQTIRRTYLQAVALRSKDVLVPLKGLDQDYVMYRDKIREVRSNIIDHPAKALSAYYELPAGLKKDKSLLLGRLRAAQRLGEAEHAKAINDLRAYYPDDPCNEMISIEHFILKKDYARAYESVNQLEKALGGDPNLHVVRAGIKIAINNFDAARQLAKQAIGQEPSLQNAYWALVTISLKEKRFDETLQALLQIRDRFPAKVADISKLPEYAEFVKSPQYKRWLKALADRERK